MKKFTSLALVIMVLAHSSVFAVQQEVMPRLTNKEIIQMVKAGLSAEVIVSKIKVSRCNFDTDPSILAELKRSGVSNDVIRAMVEAPYGPPRTESVRRTSQSKSEGSSAAEIVGQEIIIPDGKEFTVLTIDEISSKTASENDPVSFRVAEEVRVGNRVVIASGTLVKGTIASVEQRGHLGKGGKLGLRVESTTAVDGQKVKLRASKGKGDTGTVGSTIALSLIISPLFLLRRGNHAVIKPSTRIQVFTDEEKKVEVTEESNKRDR